MLVAAFATPALLSSHRTTLLPSCLSTSCPSYPSHFRLPTACISSHHAPLLLRAARGEPVTRPPVWLMRQAGRYMADFRAYSDVHPFRHRSETPDIALALSLQPFRAFRTDAVIMFSDILTPFPAVGISFDILPGKGPRIPHPIRSPDDVARFEATPFDPAADLPFVAELLHRLQKELAAEDTTLVGFVGAPFTLAAYAIEGSAAKHLVHTKRFMYSEPARQAELHRVLAHFADVIGEYAVFQADHGAQVVQLFDSWAHHLSPDQYALYALPYARRAAEYAKKHRPHVPLIFFANGSGGKLEMIQKELSHVVDVISIDWSVSMADARKRLGPDAVLQGNVDPAILATGTPDAIREAVRDTVRQSAPGTLILNLGHGVIKETPEESVAVFCDAARSMTLAAAV